MVSLLPAKIILQWNKRRTIPVDKSMERVESHEAWLPTLPTLFGNPFGILTALTTRYVFSYPLNSNHHHRKGLVTDLRSTT
jgi:hypothetical protein